MDGTELPANSRDRSPESSQRRSLDSKDERLDTAYDENRYGRYALRVVDGYLIELPLPAGLTTTRWIATLWRETAAART